VRVDRAQVDLENGFEIVAESPHLAEAQILPLGRRLEPDAETAQIIAEGQHAPIVPDLHEARVFGWQARTHFIGLDLREATVAQHAHHVANDADLVAEIQPGDLTVDEIECIVGERQSARRIGIGQRG